MHGNDWGREAVYASKRCLAGAQVIFCPLLEGQRSQHFNSQTGEESLIDGVDDVQQTTDQILVCGLGSLGRHCVRELAAFGVWVSAIDIHPIQERNAASIASLLDQFFQGDCRDEELLYKVEIGRYRSILLVTSDDRVNIEAAMTARMLNPDIRVVMRSRKEELNALLAQEIENFVSFEAVTLAAPAFAMAALEDERVAQFRLRDKLVQVTRQRVSTGAGISRFSTVDTVILGGGPSPFTFEGFYRHHPGDRLCVGDTLLTLSVSSDSGIGSRRHKESRRAEKGESDSRAHGGSRWRRSLRSVREFLQQKIDWIVMDQIRRVACICSLVVLFLLILGGFLFYYFTPDATFVDSLYATVVLILGGYSDLLGGDLDFKLPIPWWLRLFGLMLTLSGTLFVGLVYAVFTQFLLSMRFKFNRDIPIPETDHVIVYGIRRVGLVVAERLMQFGQSLVGVDEMKSVNKNISYVPLAGHAVETALIKANVQGAKCLVALSRDELENLEVGLLARSISPDIKLIIRTHDNQFSKKLLMLWPKAHILSTASLAAEAFAAATFGENVQSLFRLGDKTILVTEYFVATGDSLINRTLGYFSNAFGVVPLLLVKAGNAASIWLPFDDNLLQQGDTLYVLATIDKITRIEEDKPFEACYRLYVEKPLSDAALFEGANVLSRLTGKNISFSRRFMKELPAFYPQPVYLHQGMNLVASLKQNMVFASLMPIDDTAV